MAIKNLQTATQCIANSFGVRATGLERKAEMGHVAFGPSLLSLPRLPLSNGVPMELGRPDGRLVGNDPATAQAVLWTGRSKMIVAVLMTYRHARSAWRTVLSGWFGSATFGKRQALSTRG